ncbi:MAG: hypothetical protein COV67_14530 [Nitrospinae bacterium CG11_big_fil_rev_8_21_14_0_20_56_8]|nr:MAG: hypothetical protein COV67_14530 [Nitrospinae bacterium CG11_big_fil_rev_8_21_14_0_20_56_8]
MDTEAVNPTGRPPVEPARPRPSSSPASRPAPPVDVQTPSNDSVSLSNEGKRALEQVENATGGIPAPNAEGQSTLQNPEATIPPEVQRQIKITDNNQVVVKIVDGKTQKVVRQIPAEEVLRLKNAMKDVLDNL